MKDDEVALIQFLIQPVKSMGWEKVIKGRARDILWNQGMYSSTEEFLKNYRRYIIRFNNARKL